MSEARGDEARWIPEQQSAPSEFIEVIFLAERGGRPNEDAGVIELTIHPAAANFACEAIALAILEKAGRARKLPWYRGTGYPRDIWRGLAKVEEGVAIDMDLPNLFVTKSIGRPSSRPKIYPEPTISIASVLSPRFPNARDLNFHLGLMAHLRTVDDPSGQPVRFGEYCAGPMFAAIETGIGMMPYRPKSAFRRTVQELSERIRRETLTPEQYRDRLAVREAALHAAQEDC